MRSKAAVETLGTYIRRARVRLGINLRELASRLAITPSYLSDIENDRRVPAHAVLEAISQHLGLDLNELLARAGRLDPETQEYLRRSPAAIRLFRRIAAHGLDEADLARLERNVDKLRKRSER